MNYKSKLHDIKAFVFDYDGVISDGNIWSANDQIIVRSGNVKDGYAENFLIKNGYAVKKTKENLSKLNHELEKKKQEDENNKKEIKINKFFTFRRP